MATGIQKVYYWVDLEGVVTNKATLLSNASWTALNSSSLDSTSTLEWSLSAIAPTVTSGSNLTATLHNSYVSPGAGKGSKEGSYNLYLKVVDYAGNELYEGANVSASGSTLPASLKLKVYEKTAPTGSCSPASYSYYANTSGEITFTCADTGAGINTAKSYIKIYKKNYPGAYGTAVTKYLNALTQTSGTGKYFARGGAQGSWTKTETTQTLSSTVRPDARPYRSLSIKLTVANIVSMFGAGDTNFSADGEYKVELYVEDYDADTVSSTNATKVCTKEFMLDRADPDLTVDEDNVPEVFLHYPNTQYAVGTAAVLKTGNTQVKYSGTCSDWNGVSVSVKVDYSATKDGTYTQFIAENQIQADTDTDGVFDTTLDLNGADGVYKVTFTARDRFDKDAATAGIQSKTKTLVFYVYKDTVVPAISLINLSPSPVQVSTGYAIGITLKDN